MLKYLTVLFIVTFVVLCIIYNKETFVQQRKVCFVLSGRSFCYNDPMSPTYLIQETSGETYVSLNHSIPLDLIKNFNVVKADHRPYNIDTEFDKDTIKSLKSIVEEIKYHGEWSGFVNTLSMHYHHLNNLNNIPKEKYDVVFYLRSDIQMSQGEYDKLIDNVMNKEIKKNTIYVCKKQYKGVCDQYAYGDYDSMSKYLSVYSQIPNFVSLYSQIPNFVSVYSYIPKMIKENNIGFVNAERILEYYLNNVGLNVDIVNVTYNLNKNRNSENCDEKYNKNK